MNIGMLALIGLPEILLIALVMAVTVAGLASAVVLAIWLTRRGRK